MKKLASSLLVCSLLAAPCNASALISDSDSDLSKILSNLKSDTSNDTMSKAELEKVIDKSVDKSVNKSLIKTVLKLAKDKKSLENIAKEIEKTRKGSTLWRIVKFPFSAAWTVVKSAGVFALAMFLPISAAYLWLSSQPRADFKSDLTSLLKTLKELSLGKYLPIDGLIAQLEGNGNENNNSNGESNN